MMKHHAYLILGSEQFARFFLESQKILNVPDTYVQSFDKLLISDARKLKDEAYKTPRAGTHRIFFISASQILREAQNSLLKLFEEPPKTAIFYIAVPHKYTLLPTLYSRFFLIASEQGRTSSKKGRDFLQMSYKERLDAIPLLLKKENSTWIKGFLEAIENELRTRDVLSELRAFSFINEHIHEQGASKKMLLEYFALSCSEKLR